jgi:hypothetical protein
MATMTVSVSIVSAEDTDNAEASTCGKVLIFLSWVLVFLTMPISLLVCFKVSFLLLVIIGDKRKGAQRNGPDQYFILEPSRSFIILSAAFLRSFVPFCLLARVENQDISV